MQHDESYFSEFREKTIGNHLYIPTQNGVTRLVYADWTASGRLYEDVELIMQEKIGPFVANTHTEASITGRAMTEAYHYATQLIRKHVGATDDDIMIPCGNGTTTAINKLQRILGLKIHEQWIERVRIKNNDRPVVFVSHMEHHSNHTSWLETIADVVCLEPDENGMPNPQILEEQLDIYRKREFKIGSFTACSNVTGIHLPYRDLAKIMHQHEGFCFVDFAASAPYEPIDMHPEDSDEELDAIFFSPHKFLGGPGSSGILVFNQSLYQNEIPDQPGGGTVDWTNPWGGRSYVKDIEAREDGGTPGFLQTFRAALAIQLKEKMDTTRMMRREAYLTNRVIDGLKQIPKLHVFADNVTDRLGIISFYVEHIHYNLVVKLLSDKYGIQTRGGCQCAGTYGHYLLGIDKETSQAISDQIDLGNLIAKPGWVRLSLHPTMTDREVTYIVNSIAEIVDTIDDFRNDYEYIVERNAFVHKKETSHLDIQKWFAM